MAMDWLGDYSQFGNVILAINAPRMLREISNYLQIKNGWDDNKTNKKIIYLPNYYPNEFKKAKKIDKDKPTIDIACFGAIRPLKNHLVQAFAAIEFANKLGKKLNFHVNAGRIEMNGSPVINNLKGLFQHLAGKHEMINHTWCPREQFLELCSTMDLGLQCSFSETFNIVGADLISQGIPLIGSKEIPWCAGLYSADPTNSEDIVKKMERSYNWACANVFLHQGLLYDYTKTTESIWYKYFNQ